MSTSATERDLRRDDVLTAIQSLLVVVVIATFVVTFIVQPFRIPSESMDPTLRVGDLLLMNKQAFAPHGKLDFLLPPTPVQRGDISVFHYPVDPQLQLIKRVVALPGDHLRIHGHQVFVNGRLAVEPYAVYRPAMPDAFRDEFPTLHAMDANVDPAWWSTMRSDVHDGELYVPRDAYFVMGDNRNDSEDSRYWGFVHGDAFMGRPFVVYLSLAPAEPSTGMGRRLAAAFRHARVVR